MEPNQTSPETKRAARKCPAVLPSDARMTDDDWPGVVCMVGEGHRVALNEKANRYALQSRCDDDGRSLWLGTGGFFATATALRKAAARIGLECERVASGLPESPRDVLSEFREAAKAAADAWRATDTRRHDYGWTVQTVRHVEAYAMNPDAPPHRYDWLRLIVTPERQVMLQAAWMGSTWGAVVMADTPRQLAALLRRDVVPLLSSSPCDDDGAELWLQGLADGSILAMVERLPDDVRDLDLPDMPARPKPLWASGRPVGRSAASGRASAPRGASVPETSRKARRRKP